MAITVTDILAGTDTYIADVASDGTDVASGNIPHGLGAIPSEVTISPRTADLASIPVWGIIQPSMQPTLYSHGILRVQQHQLCVWS